MLRDVQPLDLPTLFAFESDPAWRAMVMVKRRSAAAFDAVWAKIFQDRAAGVMDVVQKVILADGEVCGTIGCRLQDGKYEVGYGLGQAFWGRGIASCALGLLLAEVPLRPLYAMSAVTNIASIRVLTKHGFVIIETRTSPETERCLAREEVSLMLA
jgi:RimJ/RimL family protein N-acetyltransferase